MLFTVDTNNTYSTKSHVYGNTKLTLEYCTERPKNMWNVHIILINNFGQNNGQFPQKWLGLIVLSINNH